MTRGNAFLAFSPVPTRTNPMSAVSCVECFPIQVASLVAMWNVGGVRVCRPISAIMDRNTTHEMSRTGIIAVRDSVWRSRGVMHDLLGRLILLRLNWTVPRNRWTVN